MAATRTKGSRAESADTIEQVPSPAWLTYETYYGLKDKPFSLSSDPAFFYSSRVHAAAFNNLLSGIRRRETLSVLSGDIGMGKTTLCRAVVQNLDRQTFSSFVSDPFATREDLLKVVLADFGIVSARELAMGALRGASRTELSFLLYEFLGTLAPLQAFAVLFIDEAQNLSPQLLEEIRILSDSDGRERHLQVVLVGQLELRDKLRLPEMRQVAQRISVRCDLEPLDAEGVAGYIAHRIAIAGGTADRLRFSAEAVDAIYEASGGVPRLINRLCDRSLHHGHLQRTAIIGLDTLALVGREAAVPSDAARTPEPVAAAPLAHPPAAPAPVKVRVSRPVGVAPLRHRTADEPQSDIFDASEEWFKEFDARVEQAVDSIGTIGSPDAFDVNEPLEVLSPEDEVVVRPETEVPADIQDLQQNWIHRLKLGAVLLAVVAERMTI